jgi:hypothetical protein
MQARVGTDPIPLQLGVILEADVIGSVVSDPWLHSAPQEGEGGES